MSSGITYIKESLNFLLDNCGLDQVWQLLFTQGALSETR